VPLMIKWPGKIAPRVSNGCPELEQSIVMSANPCGDLRDQFLVVTHVRDHRDARLDLGEHVACGVWAWSIVVMAMRQFQYPGSGQSG
jgi:hypothetical protein